MAIVVNSTQKEKDESKQNKYQGNERRNSK